MVRSISALCAVAAAAAPAASLLVARPVLAQPTSAPIVGGSSVSTCEWPSVVMLLEDSGAICSGTLVSPRIVLYAAHCGTTFTRVIFGEGFSAGYFAPVNECRQAGPGDAVGPTDYAYCELTRPIRNVPIAPVLFGCERDILTPGREAVVVGFGRSDNLVSGEKRWATTTYRGLTMDDMLLVGGDGIGASFGDSGGPALVRLDDGSWRSFGIVSGGPDPGEPVSYVDMSTTVAWVEETSGHDITPCHAIDGTWQPGFECGGFASDPLAGGTWDRQCSEEDPLSGRSSVCGPSHPADEEPPQLAVLSPRDGEVIDVAPSDVTVEIDASDATSAVRRVYLSVDDEFVAEDVSSPWSFAWTFEKGGYVLAAYAEDEGGNVAKSEELELYVGEEPSGGCLGCRAGRGREGGGLGVFVSIAMAAALWFVVGRTGSRRSARARARTSANDIEL